MAKDISGRSEIFSEKLDQLRSQLPVKLASELIDKKLLRNILLICSGSVSGFVTSGPEGAILGLAGSVVVGHIGEQIIKLGLKKIRWDLFLEYVTNAIGCERSRVLQQFALGFGDVTVLSPKEY